MVSIPGNYQQPAPPIGFAPMTYAPQMSGQTYSPVVVTSYPPPSQAPSINHNNIVDNL